MCIDYKIIFLFLFPILRTFSLHNSDQPLRNARNDLFTCRPLFSFYLWASVHSSCYAQIFLKSSALKSPNLASILCAVNRAQNEIYCDLLCYKSSASCTFHRVLHSIILSFRVLRMKTSIEMCNKGRSCQVTYARQCLLSFSWIFLLSKYLSICHLKCLFPIKINQLSSRQHSFSILNSAFKCWNRENSFCDCLLRIFKVTFLFLHVYVILSLNMCLMAY